MHRLLLMIGFQTIRMLFAVGVWAIPEPVLEEGVAFKLMRVNRPGVEVSQLSKRQTSQYPSALGDISDDCMPPDYLT
jgi:hypothetical protein